MGKFLFGNEGVLVEDAGKARSRGGYFKTTEERTILSLVEYKSRKPPSLSSQPERLYVKLH